MENNIRYFPGIVQTRAMGAELPEETDDKYWIRVLATNDEVDMHHSIMDPETTLRNYEKDAKTKPGVALKDHHAYRSFGYGRSENAILTADNELFIDFFILKDMEYDAGSREFRTSEKLIRAIEKGLINQVSIGFYGGREICNISGLPIRRYSFWEWDDDSAPKEKSPYKMGKIYEVDGKKVRATYTVYDAHLKEVSLVEFGSNRNTAIEKKREMRSFMEELFMTDQEWIGKLREALAIPNVKTTDDPDAAVETIQAEVTSLREQVETLRDEKADLIADAADGKAYRKAQVDEGIKQGIRAYGDDFDEAYHREYYGDLPLDTLEKHIEQNKKMADAKLPAGRSTQDTHEPPPETREKVSEHKRRLRGRGRRR